MTQLVPVMAHEHVYGDPVFNWSSDYSKCTAVFSCLDCGANEGTDCVVKSVTIEGTIYAQTFYRAYCNFNGKEYDDSRSTLKEYNNEGTSEGSNGGSEAYGNENSGGSTGNENEGDVNMGDNTYQAAPLFVLAGLLFAAAIIGRRKNV